MICKAGNYTFDEALEVSDTYLTVLICESIENRIFETRFNDLVQKKLKK